MFKVLRIRPLTKWFRCLFQWSIQASFEFLADCHPLDRWCMICAFVLWSRFLISHHQITSQMSLIVFLSFPTFNAFCQLEIATSFQFHQLSLLSTLVSTIFHSQAVKPSISDFQSLGLFLWVRLQREPLGLTAHHLGFLIG